MASPKSGKLCTLVPPAGPKKPHEADNANPGEVEEIKAEQRKTQSGKYGESRIEGHKPDEQTPPEEQKKSWIEIVLKDQDGEPVSGEPYRVLLPDGSTIAEGTLDSNGFARIDGIDPGTCKVTFPNRDQSCWKPA
ncbi:MAG: hypothetical protein KIT19_04945 [Phycisphaeraceae bacterium]|nr:hypothetical protein [Phycisphaeraceae bacterium]